MKDGMYGDWGKVLPRITLVATKLTPEARKYLSKKGHEFVDRVVAHIDAQDLSVPALAVSTVKKKGHNRWWFESGRFKRLLSVTSARKGSKGCEVYAGARGDIRYNKRWSMFQLATMLELGWGDAPGRPIFKYTLREFEKGMKDMEEEIGKKLRVYTGGL